ncbi:hypothetical protein ALC57_11404 [Trachymyrmex cornetzi]|uniref:Uncharacterized protein n=1 Tax=Trachymyrmex cornetzi TaxID=471704 RepID=A0A151J2P5_9HYME|nr:hypothetical protein ALC57_11404 [Trachymyrmex cornetzi]
MAPAGRTPWNTYNFVNRASPSCRISDSDSHGDNDDGDIPLIVSTDNYSVSRLNVSVIFFDDNRVPCGKKRVNDYGAAPEAAQWNGSMDEPPVASLANQLLTQGIFDVHRILPFESVAKVSASQESRVTVHCNPRCSPQSRSVALNRAFNSGHFSSRSVTVIAAAVHSCMQHCYTMWHSRNDRGRRCMNSTAKRLL